MYLLITIVHVIVCLLLTVVVLLQSGRGADAGAVFGGSSQTFFGSSGAGNFLTKLTSAMAVVFMVTSLFLTYGAARRVGQSVFDDAPAPASTSTPAAPATPAAPPESTTPPATSADTPGQPAPAPVEGKADATKPELQTFPGTPPTSGTAPTTQAAPTQPPATTPQLNRKLPTLPLKPERLLLPRS